MIHIYREGERSGLGLNVGWIKGPIIRWLWINTKENTQFLVYFWLRVSKKKLKVTFSHETIEDFEKSCVDSYLFSRAMVCCTREYVETCQQILDAETLKSKPPSLINSEDDEKVVIKFGEWKVVE